MVLALLLLRQGRPRNAHAIVVLNTNFANPDYHRPLFYHVRDFLAAPQTCSAPLLIAVGHISVSESELLKARIPLCDTLVCSHWARFIVTSNATRWEFHRMNLGGDGEIPHMNKSMSNVPSSTSMARTRTMANKTRTHSSPSRTWRSISSSIRSGFCVSVRRGDIFLRLMRYVHCKGISAWLTRLMPTIELR